MRKVEVAAIRLGLILDVSLDAILDILCDYIRHRLRFVSRRTAAGQHQTNYSNRWN